VSLLLSPYRTLSSVSWPVQFLTRSRSLFPPLSLSLAVPRVCNFPLIHRSLAVTTTCRPAYPNAHLSTCAHATHSRARMYARTHARTHTGRRARARARTAGAPLVRFNAAFTRPSRCYDAKPGRHDTGRQPVTSLSLRLSFFLSLCLSLGSRRRNARARQTAIRNLPARIRPGQARTRSFRQPSAT